MSAELTAFEERAEKLGGEGRARDDAPRAPQPCEPGDRRGKSFFLFFCFFERAVGSIVGIDQEKLNTAERGRVDGGRPFRE